jgi:hypothetical protein
MAEPCQFISFRVLVFNLYLLNLYNVESAVVHFIIFKLKGIMVNKNKISFI